MFLITALLLLLQAPVSGPSAPGLQKSPYFAFVDREYIFTIEVVKPGVPILNFVSMAQEDAKLLARNIRIGLGNRKSTVRLLTVETGDLKHPMSVASLTIRPRSSFGLRIEGEFDNAKELYGVVIRLKDEEFTLQPLSSFDFENLVLKVNRLNLGSPDFREDWRVLKLDFMGKRSPVRR
ncbi:MAG: hypothetical protein GXX84_00455 [Acidobacteria bacterium]|nr:hypothetical protein [Acidobacteriota bacterium]